MTGRTIHEVVNSGLCTGCGACEAVCPAHCITFVRDAEGFDVPSLSEENCIGCGKCLRHCHVAEGVRGMQSIVADAALSKDVRQRRKSSSGGLSAAIVKSVIKQGGCAYGAAFLEGGVVRHVRVDTAESAIALQGSKYVQSKTAGIFAEVKKDVLSGREVVFIGTPCQVAGLKCYLRSDYGNLLLVDLVCHGVPSPAFWERHIAAICNGVDNKYSEISFRSKPYYEKNDFALRFPQGIRVARRDGEADAYYHAFLHGLSFRECCYGCKYACTKRVGDITLGDCASSSSISDFYPEESLSLLLVNTKKGLCYMNSLASEIETREIDLSQEAEKNHQLSAPFSRPLGRDTFYVDVQNNPPAGSGTNSEYHLTLKHTMKHLIKLLVPYRLRIRARRCLRSSR